MKKKTLTVVIVVCALLLLRGIVATSSLIKMRTCDATDTVINTLKTDSDIIEKCGSYISCSPVVTGAVYVYSVGPTDGKATIEIKFTSENGKFFIIANLVENDDAWTITDYELSPR